MLSIFRTSCLILCAGLALTACGGGGGGMGTSSAPATPQYTMSTLPPGTALELTPHQGPEVLHQVGTVEANPTATYVKTDIGFDMTQGPNTDTWSFDTRPGSSQRIGPEHYQIERTGLGSGLTHWYVDLTLTAGAASNLDYATYGSWRYRINITDAGSSFGAFATGIPTAALQMPTSGSATYTGKVMGAVAFQSAPSHTFVGDLSLSANFAGNSISGTARNLQTTAVNSALITAPPATGMMNDINLTAGTITGASFSGTATPAAAQPGVTTVDIRGLTGQFGGRFYGPNAPELAGTLALTGNAAAMGGIPAGVDGSFGAHR